MNKQPSLAPEPRLVRSYHAIAIVLTVLLPLTLTYTLWERERSRAQADAQTAFEFRARAATESVRAHLQAYEQALRGAAALFATSDAVTRDDWRDYVRLLQLSKDYPGMIGIAYAPVIPVGQLDEFVALVRKADIAGYSVKPARDQSLSAPVLFIEPFADANLRALGFDLYSEPLRRAALHTARDTGTTTLSAPITLAQDLAEPQEPGIALFAPVYRRGTDPTSPAQRGTALMGFVSAGIRMSELLQKTLRDRGSFELRVYDVSNGISAELLAPAKPAAPAAQFVVENQIDLHHRLWKLEFRSTPEFESTIDNHRPQLVFVSGLLLSIALIALVVVLASTRNRALKLASDMTAELRTQQAALSASEERLALALRGSNLALFDWNVATGVVELSEQWAAILGAPPRTTTTGIRDLSALVHPDDAAHLQNELRAVLAGKQQSYAVEHQVRNIHGDWVWILSRAKVAEWDAQGRALRVTGTNVDISVRKMAEKMKKEFVGTVSHELRTPLTVIVGSLDLLKAELTGLTPDQAMMFDMARDNSARLQSLVNDILDFEKITAGAMHFKLQAVALAPFLRRAVELNRAYADRYKVRYELREPLPDVSLQADPERLMQVAANLLSNAAKFSPEGSVVTIAACLEGEGWVRISVIDRGPGIPPEFRGRIFGQFAQADSSDVRQKGGTGLGLSICKTMIEKLGGHMGFESEFGHGSTFYFELPLSPATLPPPPKAD
jgi:PAS domain S-box-containing protein